MMTDEEHNKILLDVIIAALQGYMQGNRGDQEEPSKEEQCGEVKSNFAYLLGQAIRQWRIPNDNWHTSKEAQKVWELIVDQTTSKHKDISREHLCYKETFTCKKEAEGMVIPRFKGTTRDFGKICYEKIYKLDEKRKEKEYVFNDIFIAEHTTPIADIRDALEECYKRYNFCRIRLRREMTLILDKIHITQMLRIEDRRIEECQNRITVLFLKKKYNGGSVYEYLKNIDSQQIYKAIVGKCYSMLPPKNTQNTEEYTSTLKAVKNANGNHVPRWARAMRIDKGYSIKILN